MVSMLLRVWKCKTLLVMRLTLLLCLFFAFQSIAIEAFSQNQRLSINQRNIKIEEIIQLIESETDYYFMYSAKTVDVKRTVDIKATDKLVTEILSDIFKGTNVSYKIDGRVIALSKNGEESVMGQQPHSVSGKVIDSSGIPLPGVSVVVKGTTTGTITDSNGKFVLNGLTGNSILQFSFVGMRTQEIIVGGKTNIDISLADEAVGLDEVVAVGYGTQKKKDLTGAVSSLKMTDKENLPNTNMVQALRGTIAGVNVNMSSKSGSTGNITVRGLTSLSASNSPLIIVDGIPLAGSLSDVNPNDIQTIDVLKDGAAAAVYGAKSSNGVILITTKKGTSTKPIIQYNGYYGVQEISHRIKMLDGSKYIQKIVDYQTAVGVTNPDPKNYLQSLELANYNAGITSDPLSQAIQNSITQTHNLSVSGKNDKTTYYVSGAFTDEKGIVYNDNFKRITFRSNIENKITDWLNVGMNAAFTNRDDSGLEAALYLAILNSPYAQYTDANGNNLMLVHGGGEAMAQGSRFSADRTSDLSKNQNLTGTIYANVDIPFIKGLSYRVNYSNTFNWIKHFQFTPPYYLEKQNNTGSGYKEHSEQLNWILENILTYKRKFGTVHDVEATLLYSRDHYDYNYSKLSASNFFTDVLGYNNLQLGTVQSVNSRASQSDGISMMGRINYRYKDRYLLTLLSRRDGYSAFGAGNKFGVFPSMALGWIVSQENFMKNITIVDNLKLRFSYGATGNQAISPYSSLGTMSQNNYVFGNGSTTYIGITNSTMGNQDLSWETTLAKNYGLDFAILKNRISGTLEYYDTKTKNLLVARALPSMTGYSKVNTNIGGTANHGLEIALNSKNIKTQAFEWNSSLTFSTNKNKITSLYGTVDANGKPLDDITNGWFIGQPIGAIYDYTLDGIYQVGDNIPTKFKAGYFKIVDKSGNGTIGTEDRSIIGKTTPDFRIGLGNTWSYKNFSLMVFVNSSFGGMKNNPMLNPAGYFPDRLNILDARGGYWTPDHPSTTRPSINYAMPVSHGIYESLTFVRIQDVSLSYDLPKRLITKAKINSAKVYISGKNLLTFTKWEGWDPESDGIGTGASISPYSSSNSFLPMIRSFVVGINFSF